MPSWLLRYPGGKFDATEICCSLTVTRPSFSRGNHAEPTETHRGTSFNGSVSVLVVVEVKVVMVKMKVVEVVDKVVVVILNVVNVVVVDMVVVEVEVVMVKV